MLQIIALQPGKTTGRTISAYMPGTANPRLASFGDCDYMPNFNKSNKSVAKRNGRYQYAFFAECNELSGVLKT